MGWMVRPAHDRLDLLLGEGFQSFLVLLGGDAVPGRSGKGHGVGVGLAELLLKGGVLADGCEELLEVFLGHGGGMR